MFAGLRNLAAFTLGTALASVVGCGAKALRAAALRRSGRGGNALRSGAWHGKIADAALRRPALPDPKNIRRSDARHLRWAERRREYSVRECILPYGLQNFADL
jgi:hypothetical protein